MSNLAPTVGEGRGTGIPASSSSRPMSRDDMRVVWSEADLLPRLLKDTPRHQLMLTFNRHGGKKGKEFPAGLGELIEDEAVLRKMPALDWPLDAQNDSALWTVACIDVDAESPDLLNPKHSHGSTEDTTFYQTSLATNSTPAQQHLVWLMTNVPAPSMMHNAHVLATWELDVEGSERKHKKTEMRHTGKQKKQKKVYPRVQLHEPGNVAIRPMAELSLEDRARLQAERVGMPKEQRDILEAKDELSQTGDLTVDDAVARDLGVAAEEGALDVPSNQRPPVRDEAINPNTLNTKAGSAPLSEQEEAQRIKRDPEARANPTQDELAALAMDTSGAPGEEDEDEQEGVEELKGPHRLVFVVYRQNAKVPTRTLPEDSMSNSRHSFNLGRFVHSYPQIDSDQVWAGSFLFVGPENEGLLNEQRRYNSLMRPIEDQVYLPAGGAKHPRPAKHAGFDASALKHNQIATKPEKDDIEA